MAVLSSKLNLAMASTDDGAASFESLFLAHYDRVYGLLYRLLGTRAEAEDLTQEVFLKLYQTPPQQADSNVAAWLYRVATNLGYNAIRGRRRRWERNTLLVPPEDGGVNPAQALVTAEEIATVRAALAQLTPAQGQLLLLRQMGLSYSELASACDTHPNSVGKRLSRAAQAFRSAYLHETKGKKDV
jgi:RNA polymerase sigma-70 factor (ECF subfamily)